MIDIKQGDCLELMKEIPNKSIDMVLCDLPYGTTRNKWDACLNFECLWEEYSRIVKSSGNVLLFSQGVFTAKTIMSNPNLFKYKIVWQKSKATNFLNAKKQPLRKHEDICVFYRCKPTYNPQMVFGKAYDKGVRKDQTSGCYNNFQPFHIKSDGERYPSDVIYFKTAETEGVVLHPTQKPVALLEYLINTYTNAGDIVLDNCMGSGSTGVACMNTNRKFIGIEKDLGYFKIAKERIENSNKSISHRKVEQDEIFGGGVNENG